MRRKFKTGRGEAQPGHPTVQRALEDEAEKCLGIHCGWMRVKGALPTGYAKTQFQKGKEMRIICGRGLCFAHTIPTKTRERGKTHTKTHKGDSKEKKVNRSKGESGGG